MQSSRTKIQISEIKPWAKNVNNKISMTTAYVTPIKLISPTINVL